MKTIKVENDFHKFLMKLKIAGDYKQIQDVLRVKYGFKKRLVK